MTYYSQRPQCPSLSPHVLLVWGRVSKLYLQSGTMFGFYIGPSISQSNSCLEQGFGGASYTYSLTHQENPVTIFVLK